MRIRRPNDAELGLAEALLTGQRRLSRLNPLEYDAVATALPEVAERAWFDSPARRQQLVAFLDLTVGPWAAKTARNPPPVPWQAVVTAAEEARALLTRRRFDRDVGAHFPEGLDHRDLIRRPEVLTLLVGQPEPARTMLTFERRPTRPAASAACAMLCRFFFGLPEVDWALDLPAIGESCMAAYMLRCAAELHPAAFRGFEPIGITGELTAPLSEDLSGRGIAGHVAGVLEKVTTFFDVHAAGVCIVPSANYKDLLEYRSSAARVRRIPWERVYSFDNFRELMVRFGVTLPVDRGTRFYAHVREAAAQPINDWRYRLRPVGQIVDIPLVEADGAGRGFFLEDLALRVRMTQPRPRIVLQGPPGTGKSFLLRRLHGLLSYGSARLDGPSLFVRAADLRDHDSLHQAIAQELHRAAGPSEWRAAEAKQFIGRSPFTADRTWLLIDGLNELPSARRTAVLKLIQSWAGPVCVTTRRAPEKFDGAWHLEVASPSPSQVKALLDLEEDLAPPGDAPAGPHPPPEVEVLLHDVGVTPFSISLLGMIADEPGGLRGLAPQQVLARQIAAFLERAVSERQLHPKTVQLFLARGETVVGAVAWTTILSGRSTFRLEEVRTVAASWQWGEDDIQRLTQVIEFGGFAEPAGGKAWRFSRAAVAEHYASTFVRSAEGRRQLLDVLDHVVEPAIRGRLVRIALRQNPGETIEALLAVRERPFKALRLAALIAAESEDASVDEGMVVEILRRTLSLRTHLSKGASLLGASTYRREEDLMAPPYATWYQREHSFPEEFLLPADVTRRLTARWKERLRKRAPDLIAALDPAVRALLGDESTATPLGGMSACPIHRRHEPAGDDSVTETLRLLLDLSGGGSSLLRLLTQENRPRTSSLFSLAPHEQDRTELDARIEAIAAHEPLADVALHAWLHHASEPQIARRLPRLIASPRRRTADDLLCHVARRCSAQLRREAILRYAFVWGAVPDGRALPPALAACRAPSLEGRPFPWPIDEAWTLAWQTGALGALPLTEGDATVAKQEFEPLAVAYAYLLDDPCGLARLRALMLWRTFERDYEGFPPHGCLSLEDLRGVVSMLVHDASRAVRLWAMAAVIEFKIPCPEIQASPSYTSPYDGERWLADACLWGSRSVRVDVTLLLNALCSQTPLDGRAIESPSGAPAWARAVPHSDREAYERLIDVVSSREVSLEVARALELAVHRNFHGDHALALLRRIGRHCERLRGQTSTGRAPPDLDEVLAVVRRCTPAGPASEPPEEPTRARAASVRIGVVTLSHYFGWRRSMPDQLVKGSRRGNALLAECRNQLDAARRAGFTPEQLLRREAELRREAAEALVREVLDCPEEAQRMSAETALGRLGGFNASHRALIAEHLRKHPGCTDAIVYWFLAGASEGELLAHWEQIGMPWLISHRGP